MAWGGKETTHIARRRATERGRAAARDPRLSKQDNPESHWRDDLRRAWDHGYQQESVKMELGL